MERVRAVDVFRKASVAKSTRDYPYPALYRQVTQPTSDYVLVPRHSSENRPFIPFGFFSKDIIVGDSCFAIPNAEKFHFGVIQSTMHMVWVRAVCGRIKSDYRYSKDIVYNNFPWPIEVSNAQKAVIENAVQGVLDARSIFPAATLADLYDPHTMPSVLINAHLALDRAVDTAYVSIGGKKSWASEAERVSFLFDLHQRLTSLLPVEEKKKRRSKAKA